MRRSNTVGQMYQQLPHMNFPIFERSTLSYMSGLADIVAGSNLGNLEYHQSVAESYPSLVLKVSYKKYLDDVDTFNISRLDGGK